MRIIQSDHDRGGFGQRLELGRLRAKKRGNGQRRRRLRREVLEITLPSADNFNLKARSFIGLAFSFLLDTARPKLFGARSHDHRSIERSRVLIVHAPLGLIPALRQPPLVISRSSS